METTALLTALRETFYQLQTITQSSDLSRVIAYYENAVDQPLIVNLRTVYTARLDERETGRGTWNAGAHKRSPVYAPVTEQVLLTFCQRYKYMLKPPAVTELGTSPLVLPHGLCTLPITSLEQCIDVYLGEKPVTLGELTLFA